MVSIVFKDVGPRCNANVSIGQFFFYQENFQILNLRSCLCSDSKSGKKIWGSPSKYSRKKLSNLTWVVYGKGVKIGLSTLLWSHFSSIFCHLFFSEIDRA